MLSFIGKIASAAKAGLGAGLLVASMVYKDRRMGEYVLAVWMSTIESLQSIYYERESIVSDKDESVYVLKDGEYTGVSGSA